MIAFGMTCSEIRVCLTSQTSIDSHNWNKGEEKYKDKPRHASKRKSGSRISETGTNSEIEQDSSKSEDEDESGTGVIHILTGHTGPVQAVQFHPRTKLLYSVGQDSTMRAWDVNTFKCRTIYRQVFLCI